jgi:hypothetical protein
MIPPFDPRGLLPPGLHPARWTEFAARFGGTPRRQALLVGLREALENLRDAGCSLAYVDGSFVTVKPEPGDYDACWGIRGVIPERLDPVLLDFSDGRAAQKARFGGELFPAELPEGGSGRTFLEFFQTDRETGRHKGIVALEINTLALNTLDLEDDED